MAKSFGAEYTTEISDLLGPEIDAVSVATPDHLHRDAVVALLEEGNMFSLKSLWLQTSMMLLQWLKQLNAPLPI